MVKMGNRVGIRAITTEVHRLASRTFGLATLLFLVLTGTQSLSATAAAGRPLSLQFGPGEQGEPEVRPSGEEPRLSGEGDGRRPVIGDRIYDFWFDDKYAEPDPMVMATARTDKILIEKSARKLSLIQYTSTGRELIFAEYEVSLGRNPEGPKTKEGDKKTPEGVYKIKEIRRQGRTGYYMALLLNYPLPEQIREAKARGEDPGSLIMIHGIKNGFEKVGKLHRLVDWTLGCIAVTNQEMDQIIQTVRVGTEIEIVP